MSQRDWDKLTATERAFMINAFEIDILPGVWADLEPQVQDAPLAEVAAVLLSLVDHGWIEVRRIVPWTAPDGRVGCQPGGLVSRADLVDVLADPRSWEYPDDPSSWIGCLTLVETDAGRKITRKSPEEIAAEQHASS